MKKLWMLPVAIIAIGIFSSCNKSADSKQLSENKAIVEKINKAFETGDMATLDNLIAADGIDHDPMNTTGKKGPESAKEAAKIFKEAFPDMKINIQKMVAEGDIVSCFSTMTGTNSGSLMGKPATNKQVKLDVVDIVRIKDGKAVEHWTVSDNMAMAQQLGWMDENNMGGKSEQNSSTNGSDEKASESATEKK